MNSLGTVITLKEISRISGYAVSTVSKALNNKFDVSSETRKVIKNIAEAHNYIPNNHAVSLRKKRTKAISVIIPQVNTHFYSYFLYNIQKVAYSFGYRIILFQSFEDDSKEKEFINASNDGSVDGIIVLSRNVHYKKLNSLPIEYIQINEDVSNERLSKDCINSFSKLLRRLNK